MLILLTGILFFSPLCAAENSTEQGVTEVSPTEDLMREHGVLNRVLLIYDEFLRRFTNEIPFAPELLNQSATIIQKFIENYHEKLEEEYLFPRLEKAQTMIDLVNTLRKQHNQGRLLTTFLIAHSTEKDFQDRQQLSTIKEYLHEFIKMYRPHEAREDTILFPAFKNVISQKEYDELGELFEAKEQELFGKNGFEKIVEEVASIEKALGIYNLSQFTPELSHG